MNGRNAAFMLDDATVVIYVVVALSQSATAAVVAQAIDGRRVNALWSSVTLSGKHTVQLDGALENRRAAAQFR